MLLKLEEGHKRTHTSFTENEWIMKHDSTHYIFENGVIVD